MIYRTLNNVPDIYINGSRDFQLLGRLLDTVVNDSKFYIDDIVYINDVNMCPTNLLPLLATKLGFFTKYELSERELRGILRVFPWLIRYKGSRRAIYQAVFIFFRLVGINPNFSITIQNKPTDGEKYQIIIAFQSRPFNMNVLNALLDYILPPGYTFRYIYTVKPTAFTEETSYEHDKIEGIIVGNTIDTQLRGEKFDDTYVGQDIATDNRVADELLSGVDTALTGHILNDADVVRVYDVTLIGEVISVELNDKTLIETDYDIEGKIPNRKIRIHNNVTLLAGNELTLTDVSDPLQTQTVEIVNTISINVPPVLETKNE